VKVFTVLLDTRPAYFETGGDEASMLLAPLGAGTLLCELHARLPLSLGDTLVVAPTFVPTPRYVQAIRDSCSLVSQVTPLREYVGGLAGYDLTDPLLLVDPTCFPVQPLDWPRIHAELPKQTGGVTHIVSLEANPGGTTERVELDDSGQVQRIQRYYDQHTWIFAQDVACTIVPLATLVTAKCFDFESLRELRQLLSARGVPGRDLNLGSGALNLRSERALLRLSERTIFANTAPDAPEQVHPPTAAIAPTARLVGPVIVQHGAVIDAHATIVGPTVIGAGARIGRNATIAQCLVARGTRVRAESVARHRVVAGEVRAGLETAPAMSADVDPPLVPARTILRPRYLRAKAAVDAILAAIGLLVLSPVLAIIAALIKLDSRGPVLYGDRRETMGGRPFRCWKFRTMCVGADTKQRELLDANQVDGPQFKMNRDPRITRVGRHLRRFNLDEFPQLINVLRGEMSLVGPRPSPFRENQICIPWRDARLSVRPGITGLWQVCRDHRETSGDFHQWIYYDLLYVTHMSPWMDVKILVATALTLVGFDRVPLSWIIPSASEPRVPTSVDPALSDSAQRA
jgi:lipopolysaccharide/colanic/teichoic acid biosynthesis glycosyltransferase